MVGEGWQVGPGILRAIKHHQTLLSHSPLLSLVNPLVLLPGPVMEATKEESGFETMHFLLVFHCLHWSKEWIRHPSTSPPDLPDWRVTRNVALEGNWQFPNVQPRSFLSFTISESIVDFSLTL